MRLKFWAKNVRTNQPLAPAVQTTPRANAQAVTRAIREQKSTEEIQRLIANCPLEELIPPTRGNGLIHHFPRMGHSTVAEIYHALGQRGVDLGSGNMHGNTPAHIVLQTGIGKIQKVAALVALQEYGANLHAPNDVGQSPAQQNRSAGLVEEALRYTSLLAYRTGIPHDVYVPPDAASAPTNLRSQATSSVRAAIISTEQDRRGSSAGQVARSAAPSSQVCEAAATVPTGSTVQPPAKLFASRPDLQLKLGDTLVTYLDRIHVNKPYDADLFASLASWAEQSCDQATIAWLLSSVRQPHAVRHRDAHLKGFKYSRRGTQVTWQTALQTLGRTIAAMPRQAAIDCTVRCLTAMENSTAVDARYSQMLRGLSSGLKCHAEKATRDQLLALAAQMQQRLRQREECKEDKDLKARDVVADASPAEREADYLRRCNTASKCSREEIHKRLEKIESQEWKGYDDFDKFRSVFVDALVSEDDPLLHEVEGRILFFCESRSHEYGDLSGQDAAAWWAAKMAAEAEKRNHSRSPHYFADALRRASAGGYMARGAVFYLCEAIPERAPQDGEHLQSLSEFIWGHPEVPSYAVEGVLSALARRGHFAPMMSIEAQDIAPTTHALLGQVPDKAVIQRLRGTFAAGQRLRSLAATLPKDSVAAAYAAHRHALGDGYAALVLSLFDASSQAVACPVRDHLLALAQALTNEEKRCVVSCLFANPQLAHRVSRVLAVQENIVLAQGGNADGTFVAFANAMLAQDRWPTKLGGEKLAQSGHDLPKADIDDAALRPPNFRAHGRTLHFKDGDGNPRALKLPKLGNMHELRHEAAVTGVLAGLAPQVGLQSRLPQPLGWATVSLNETMNAALLKQAGNAGSQPFLSENVGDPISGLLFTPPPDYTRYLHDAADETELRHASARCLTDVARLARQTGLILDAPADLFHNSEGAAARRYYWNVEQLGAAADVRTGAGRLERTNQATAHPNFGLSGLRGLNQIRPLSHIAANEQEDLGSAATALMTRLGDMQFAWALSVGRWYEKQGNIADSDAIAETLRLGMTQFFAAYTGRDVAACAHFVDGLVNWLRLGRQMSYFLSTAYVKDVAQNKVKSGIYDANTSVTLINSDEHLWDRDLGWSVNGTERDLGPRNGPLPITELVRALYVLTSIGITLGHS